MDEIDEEQDSDVEGVQKDPEEVAKIHQFSLKVFVKYMGKIKRFRREKQIHKNKTRYEAKCQIHTK